jgi:hypothetical protein
MHHSLLFRIGTFFILIGIGLFVLFLGSVFAGQLSMPYFLFAAVAFFLGTILHRAAPHPEPTRFSGIRKATLRSRQRREEKQTLKDQDK